MKDFGIAQLTEKFSSDMGVRNDENLGMLENCLKDRSEVDLCVKSINKKSAGHSSSSSCLPLTSTTKYDLETASVRIFRRGPMSIETNIHVRSSNKLLSHGRYSIIGKTFSLDYLLGSYLYAKVYLMNNREKYCMEKQSVLNM